MKESFDDVRPFAQFIPFDILKNAIPEYCFASSNDIKVYDNNQKLLINYTDVDAIGIDDFQVHNFGREVLFSYSREKENQIWVLDKLGHLLPNMPLRGKGKVVISDLNQDGKYNLIVCDTYGLLYCYELY